AVTHRQGSDSLANLAQRKDTQVEQALVGQFNPSRYFDVRFGLDQLGNDIGVQQEAAHKSTVRPLSGARCQSILAFASGDSEKNRTRLCGCLVRLISRSNSSAGRITTASFPWRV